MALMNDVVVRLAAGRRADGGLVLEAVHAMPMGEPDTFRLTASPGLAQGVAAHDVVRVSPDGAFCVLERGGNLAVQILARGLSDESIDTVAGHVERLGGYLDGGSDTAGTRLRVFTIPVSSGFAAVEGVFNAFVAEHPGSEWYFANVYDPADGVTPLGWWESK